jgi:hypothetical protein
MAWIVMAFFLLHEVDSEPHFGNVRWRLLKVNGAQMNTSTSSRASLSTYFYTCVYTFTYPSHQQTNRSSCDFTNRLLDEGTEAEVLATKIQIKKQLGLLATKELSDSPPVDAAVHFYANTQALGEVVNSFASVTASSSFPPLCQAQVRD